MPDGAPNVNPELAGAGAAAGAPKGEDVDGALLPKTAAEGDVLWPKAGLVDDEPNAGVDTPEPNAGAGATEPNAGVVEGAEPPNENDGAGGAAGVEDPNGLDVAGAAGVVDVDPKGLAVGAAAGEGAPKEKAGLDTGGAAAGVVADDPKLNGEDVDAGTVVAAAGVADPNEKDGTGAAAGAIG